MTVTSAVLRENLADDGTVVCSTSVVTAPSSRLQNPHTTRRWKSGATDTASILVTWDSAQTIDTVGLFKMAGIFDDTERDLSEDAVVRIRISSVDLTGVAGNLYDSTSVSPDSSLGVTYASIGALLTSPVSARAVLIDLSETGAEAVEAGRLVVGLRDAFTINFNFGWTLGHVDRTRRKESAGGQVFIDRDDEYRVLRATYDFLSETERYGFIEDIDRLNGLHDDVLFIRNIATTDFGRDCIWGLIEDQSPPGQPHFEWFTKTYSIRERL